MDKLSHHLKTLAAYKKNKRKTSNQNIPIFRHQDEYHSLIESIQDSVCVIDKDYKYKYINAECIRRFNGLTKNDIIGMKYGNIDNAIDNKDIEKRIKKVLCMNSINYYEYFNKKDKAHYFITLSPITNSKNIVYAVIITLKDITKFKQIEKDLLIKKKEIERIAYAVAHDLKTPIISIISFTNMLKQDILDGKKENQLKYLEVIEKNSKQVNDLLSGVNDLLRIERVAKFNVVSFNELVDVALQRFKDVFNRKIHSNNIKITVADGFPRVYVDSKLIIDMLVQLIDNSIKYTRGVKNPEIDIGYLTNTNGDCVFFVRDNGIGIDKNQHTKIFDLFYKLENGMCGSGVGLAIVKKTIEIHDGQIWVESEKGNGCKICFILPTVNV